MILIALFFQLEAHADLIAVSQVFGPEGAGAPTKHVPPPPPSADGAPINGDVWQFKATTDGDILSVNNVLITIHFPAVATLYNHPFGDPSNAEPGNPALIAVFPSLDVDSWITTPGATVRLGPDLPGDGTTTFGDLTSDGPQSEFIFAQLTFPHGTVFDFAGRVSIASQTQGNVFSQSFHFSNVPEPAACWLAVSFVCIKLASDRRNHAIR
jgi:hypothetical protein